MSWPTTPPALITQLRTQLLACASFVAAGGASATVHYPRASISSSTSYPLAVLAETNRTTPKQFTGVTTIAGSLEIELFDNGSVEELERLAQAIASEICTDTGIEGMVCDGVTQAEESSVAADVALNSCVISLSYGLGI